jgi:hypothetical protein
VVDAVQRHEVAVVLISGGDNGLGAHGRTSLSLEFVHFMVALSGRALKRDPLRAVRESQAYGRH